jgi:hypothetical protein
MFLLSSCREEGDNSFFLISNFASKSKRIQFAILKKRKFKR